MGICSSEHVLSHIMSPTFLTVVCVGDCITEQRLNIQDIGKDWVESYMLEYVLLSQEVEMGRVHVVPFSDTWLVIVCSTSSFFRFIIRLSKN